MIMITFTARNREKIISLHTDIADALEQRNQQQIEHALLALSDYTKNLADNVFAAKQKIKTDIDNQKAQS